MKIQRIAIMEGNIIQKDGQKLHEMSKEQIKSSVWLDGQLQTRFEEFAKNHEIIDWDITQSSHSGDWVIAVRYWDNVDDIVKVKSTGPLG